MHSLGSQSASNGEVSSNLYGSGLGPDDIISDDEDVVEEELPQARTNAGVFSKFRSVCQNVFQSWLGGKQKAPEKAPENTTTRIIRRRSRQTLVPGINRKPSEITLNPMESGILPTASQLGSNSVSTAPMPMNTSTILNNRPSSNNLQLAAAANANAQEIGSRLAAPMKRGYSDPSSMPASTPFRSDSVNQSFAAPWSSLKQRRLEESSVRPMETSHFIQPPAPALRPAPVIETTSLHQTIREADRYSSMTLPSAHRPASREFGSALSGETSSLTTPLGAKRRVSLFETKTMTPHFNVEKMEAVPYTMDRFPARSSPHIGLPSPKPQSPLAPRVVRLDLTANKPSPHSPLVRAPLVAVPTVVNPTAQRLARAYQQLTSASAVKPQMTPVDPTRVHLIDPAQYFSRPKPEAVEIVQSKVEPVSVRSIEPQVSQQQVQQKPGFRFASPALACNEPIVTGKINGNQSISSKFTLTAPSVLVDANSGSAGSIWTCSDCDIANSVTNDYCFSCGRSKASSTEVKVQTIEQPDIAVKRQRQSMPATNFELSKPSAPTNLIAPPTAEPTRILGGPSATSTPFVMSTNLASKKPADEDKPMAPAPKTPAAPSTTAITGGVVGQWRCSNCLFMNDFKAISCTRCTRTSTTTPAVNGVAANDSNASNTTTTPAVGASSRLKRRATMEGGWACGCQHMNPRSATVCDLCNAPKPQAPSAVAPTPVSIAPALTTSKPLAIDIAGFKPLNGLPNATSSSTAASSFAFTATSKPEALPTTTDTVRLTTATATTTSLTAPIPTPTPIFGGSSCSESTDKNAAAAASTATSTSTTASVAAPLSSTGFGAQFGPKPGQWTCDVCMVRNDKDKAKCAACESPNPNAPADATKPAAEAPKFGVLAPASTGTAPGGFQFGFGAAAKPAETKPASTAAPAISFGVTPAASSASTTATPAPALGGFKFGGSPTASAPPSTAAPPNATAPTSAFAFGSASAAPATTAATATAFAFGSLAKPATTTSAAPAPGGFQFSFGSAPTASSAAPTTTSAPAPAFGSSSGPLFGTAAATTSAPLTGFGAPSTTQAPSIFGSSASSAPAAITAAPTASVFGMPASTSAPAPSIFNTPAASSATSAFGGAFGAPQTTQAGTGLFGSTSSSAPLFGSSATAATTAASSSTSAFSFGSSAAAPAPTTTASSTGFAFGSSAPSSGFSFGSAASSTTTSAAPAPTSAFGFGSVAPAAPTATSAPAAPSAFNFGSTTSASTAPSFAFGSAATQPSAAPAAQTNGMFAFGQSAPSTGGSATSTFGQPSSQPSSTTAFAFGALAQPAASSTASATTGAFNFSASAPTFGSTATANNGTNNASGTGGFKFDTATPAFNFSAGNPPAGPAATPQPPAFSFNAGNGGFSPAQTTPGGEGGPLLFSSGASANRPKAAAVRKLKVAGRK